MTASRGENAGLRAAQLRDALLTLSRVLSSGAAGGVLSEALEIAMEGLGCSRGAAYTVGGDALELVAHRGVAPGLRDAIARVERADRTTQGARSGVRPGFVVERAARARRAQVDPDLCATAAIDPELLTASGWRAALAVPVALAREVLGVLVFAHTSREPFGPDAVTFAETAANLVALALSRQQRGEVTRAPPAADPRLAELAVTGWIAIGIGDELRRPLTELGAHLDEARALARRGADDGGSLEAVFADAGAALARANLTRDRFIGLLADDPPEAVSLGELVLDAAALVEPSFAARGVRLDLQHRGEAVVSGRRGILVQVFAQLLLRAQAASASAGGRRGRVVVSVEVEAGRGVVMIDDAGPPGEDAPPPPDALHHEGSLRAPGRATLGEAIGHARRVVSAHRGWIELGSSPLGGSKVRLGFPLTHAPAQPVVRLSSSIPAAGSDRAAALRVLWVDADAGSIRSAKRLLKACVVEVARSAEEARAAIARADAPYDRIFCELTLPDACGAALHRELTHAHPAIAQRFVFLASGALEPGVADYVVASGCPTLLKPPRADDLEPLLAAAAHHASLPPTPRLNRSRKSQNAAAPPSVPNRNAVTAANIPAARAERAVAAGRSAAVDQAAGRSAAVDQAAGRSAAGDGPPTRRSAANRRKVTLEADAPQPGFREVATRRRKDE